MLKVQNLNVHYGPIHAVKNISFHIQQGEIVSLIGANGAGKTTTLRALSGIIESTGVIEFNQQNLQTVPDYQRIGLGLAQSPEGRGIFLNLSVEENLEMGAYTRNDKVEIQKDFAECLELFPRLKERLWQTAGTLSGGEQQMLAISRALMSRPKLLLLDEPSLGLAPIIVAQIFEIITSLKKNKNMTILLVEQNARSALKISDRAYVIETGSVTLKGTGADLLHNPEVQRSYLGL